MFRPARRHAQTGLLEPGVDINAACRTRVWTNLDRRCPGFLMHDTLRTHHEDDVGFLAYRLYASVEHVRQALRVGAQGYLLKKSAGADVVDALRLVHAGGGYLSPEITGIAVCLTKFANRRGWLNVPSAGDGLPLLASSGWSRRRCAAL
jgi:hypothetical protein